MGLIHNGLGQVANAQGRFEDARVHCERALAIDRARLGEAHADLAYDLVCVGDALIGLKQWKAAAAALEEGLASMASAPAPDVGLRERARAALDVARARAAEPR
jgi:tetratricopeptide (TPR) repeat protein